MLDLQKIEQKYYELIWFNGEVLHIKSPSQKVLRQILSLQDAEDVNKQLDGMKEVTIAILSNNKENYKITDEDYEKLTFDVIQLILTDYMNSTIVQLGE